MCDLYGAIYDQSVIKPARQTRGNSNLQPLVSKSNAHPIWPGCLCMKQLELFTCTLMLPATFFVILQTLTETFI